MAPVAEADFRALVREVRELHTRFSVAEAVQKRRDDETEAWRRETREAIKDLRLRINGNGSGKTITIAATIVATAAAAAVVAVQQIMGGP